MLRNTHPTRVLKYLCRRTLPARCGLFSEAPRSLRFQCSQGKHSHGWALAARAPKIAGAPSGSHDLWIPSRGTKVAIRQKSGETLQQSPPHFAQAQSSGACGPPARPMRSVSSSKVACVCLPCLLEGYVGHQRAGCGARTGPAFRPSCNVKVIYMYIYICMHMNMCI